MVAACPFYLLIKDSVSVEIAMKKDDGLLKSRLGCQINPKIIPFFLLYEK
jgi:hypothetical protein